MKLQAAVYTAHKGYAWSQVPTGVTPSELDALMRIISEARGDFPDPLSVDTGLVSNGRLAAVFTLQNVANWDANGRAADYGAFVFFPIGLSRIFNLTAIVSQDFFWTPSHEPPTSIECVPAAAAPCPPEAIAALRQGRPYRLVDPNAVGDLLTVHGAKSTRWICLLQSDGTLKVSCNPWQ